MVLLLVALSRTIVHRNNLQKDLTATQLCTTDLLCTSTSEENIVLQHLPDRENVPVTLEIQVFLTKCTNLQLTATKYNIVSGFCLISRVGNFIALAKCSDKLGFYCEG